MEMKLQDKDVIDILQKQKVFFAEGKTQAYEYRVHQLLKLKSAILSHQKELEEALEKDLGKCRMESYFSEIGYVLADISHTLKHLKSWMKPEKVPSPMTVFASKSRVEKQPLGSVLIIGPYNYPFQLLVVPLVAAMAAGNCAVLSPSERTPHVSQAIRTLIGDTFDAEYVFCASGGAENNTALLRGKFDSIFFTGGSRVGQIVMRAAAENLVPVTLELGGKSPVIVDETANLSVACERIAWGKFLNAGQTCVAPDYVFVHKKVFTAFIEGLKGTIRRFYGEDAHESPDFGRIVNDRHMQRLCTMLEKDRESIVYGGETVPAERFIAPTVLTPEKIEQAACMGEEIFGPLLPVFAYSDPEEVIRYINAHGKPLALYVFSSDKKFVRNLLSRTSSGGVCINDTVSQLINTSLPFGGVGASGMGQYHGKYGFETFSHLRAVLKRSVRFRLTLSFPPFTRKKYDSIRRYLK